MDLPIIFSAAMVKALLAGQYDAEIASRYEAGETMGELALFYNVSRPTIAKSLIRSGIKRRAAKPRPGRLAGSANPAWSGGRRMRRDGYWVAWTTQGERLEHRVVAEATLGRPLGADEIVHHCDGDKGNNAPSNLKVMSQSEHVRHHAPEMHSARYVRV